MHAKIYATKISLSSTRALVVESESGHETDAMDKWIYFWILIPNGYISLMSSLSPFQVPPVYFLALRLKNTKVPVWTDESMGYPKMDISDSDAAIHYGTQLAQYCDPTRCCNPTL